MNVHSLLYVWVVRALFLYAVDEAENVGYSDGHDKDFSAEFVWFSIRTKRSGARRRMGAVDNGRTRSVKIIRQDSLEILVGQISHHTDHHALLFELF